MYCRILPVLFYSACRRCGFGIQKKSTKTIEHWWDAFLFLMARWSGTVGSDEVKVVCESVYPFNSVSLCNVHFSSFSIGLQTRVYPNIETNVYCIALYMNVCVLYTTRRMSICTI